MAVRIFGIGRNKARLQDRMKRLKGEYDQYKPEVEGILDRISGVSDEAYASAEQNPFDADMTAQQRFGDMIQYQTDQINQNRAGAQNAIETAMITSGGDVSGSGASTLGGFTEDANQSIGEALNYYTGMNKDINRSNQRLNLQNRQFQEQRGDQLMQSEFSGKQDLMNMTLSQLMSTRQQDQQRRQANKQMAADLIGSAMQAGGSVLGNPNIVGG